MERIVIRRLKPEDADQIREIFAAITQQPVDPAAFNRIVEEQADRSEDASYVAELEGKVVGYMIGYCLTGGFGIKKSVWIANMGVSPAHMGQGIGRQLAETIFDFSRSQGIRDVYSSVRWDSPDLLSFFKLLGFDRSNFINLRKVLD